MLRFPLLIARFLQRVGRLLDWLPPLVARISVGWVFAQSGWRHLHNVEFMTQKFSQWHVPHPLFNVYLSSYTELIGGSLLLAGLMTRLISIPLSINMVVAIWKVKRDGIEEVSDLYFLSEYLAIVVFLWLFIRGPGAVSIDYVLNYFINPRREPAADPR
jgi:putative oxidoreductase